MPRLSTCIASTAHTLTLRARCVRHSSNIPFFFELYSHCNIRTGTQPSVIVQNHKYRCVRLALTQSEGV